jgi:hypothetical protein
MKGKKALTQEQYVKEVRGMANFILNQGTRLQEIARNLNTSSDFSPATMRMAEEALTHMKDIMGCLKKVGDLNVQRGITALEEEESKVLADLKVRKAQLLEGTLRINRREGHDQAAE